MKNLAGNGYIAKYISKILTVTAWMAKVRRRTGQPVSKRWRSARRATGVALEYPPVSADRRRSSDYGANCRLGNRELVPILRSRSARSR